MRLYLLYALFHSVVIFRGSGEENIATGVKSCLYTVLYNTDNKADSYSLHGYVVADIEERTGQPVITSQNAKQLQNLVTGLIEGVVVEENDKE